MPIPNFLTRPRPEPTTAERVSTLGTPLHVTLTLERARLAIDRAREQGDALRALYAGGARVVGVSHRLVRESHGLRAQLRASVTAYVRALRASGAPPQRMLVLVKAAVCPSLPPECDADEQRALLADVVRWSIDAYYHAA